VRGADGVNDGRAKGQGRAGLDKARVFDRATGGLANLPGVRGDIDRQIKFSMKDAGAADVIHVMVADDEGVNVFDVALVLGQALLGGFAADTGVEEESDVGGFDIETVAIGAGLQGK